MADEMGVFEVMYNSRAMRRLKEDPVPEDLLVKLIDAGNQAPSGSGRQAARWIVVRGPAVRAELAVKPGRGRPDPADRFGAAGGAVAAGGHDLQLSRDGFGARHEVVESKPDATPYDLRMAEPFDALAKYDPATLLEPPPRGGIAKRSFSSKTTYDGCAEILGPARYRTVICARLSCVPARRLLRLSLRKVSNNNMLGWTAIVESNYVY